MAKVRRLVGTVARPFLPGDKHELQHTKYSILLWMDPRKKEQRCGYADAQLSPQRAKGS
jgi:hypothetical protein